MLPRSSTSLKVPLTRWQSYQIATDLDPACDDAMRRRWVLSHAVQVQPGMDLRRLRRALDKLSARHDLLRLRIVPVGDGWRSEIDPSGSVPMREIDLGDPEPATLRDQLAKIASEPMPLFETPLAEVVVAQCGQSGDVVMLRVHHAITDGFGMIVLIEDLLRLLLGMPILTPAVGHLDYLRDHHTLPADRRASADAFWDAMHRDLPPLAEIGRHGKGLAPLWNHIGDYEPRSLDVPLTPKGRSRMSAAAERLGIGTSTWLFAGFLAAACAVFHQKRLAFSTTLGRVQPSLASYMGHASHVLVLPWDATGKPDVADAAQKLGATLLSCMAHLPHEAAQRGGPSRDALMRRGIFAEQFRLGEAGANVRARKSIFGPSFAGADSAPQRVGKFILRQYHLLSDRRPLSELELVVRDPSGRGGFHLGYDGQAYSAAEIGALADRIRALVDAERVS